MPLPVEALTPNSTDQEIKQARDESMKQCIAEGRPANQCSAIVYRYIKETTGKSNLQAGATEITGGAV